MKQRMHQSILAMACSTALLLSACGGDDQVEHNSGDLSEHIYQWSKTHDRDPQRCFWAFRHNRWVGLMIFVGILLASL